MTPEANDKVITPSGDIGKVISIKNQSKSDVEINELEKQEVLIKDLILLEKQNNISPLLTIKTKNINESEHLINKAKKYNWSWRYKDHKEAGIESGFITFDGQRQEFFISVGKYIDEKENIFNFSDLKPKIIDKFLKYHSKSVSNKGVEWNKYGRTIEVEARPYKPGEDLEDFEVPKNYEPKEGDMIVRRPENKERKWIAREGYFKKYFDKISENKEKSQDTYGDRGRLSI